MGKKGSRMLQIVSILMVVGAIVLILGFVAINLLALLSTAGAQTSTSGLFTLIGLIGALLQLVSGILGLRYWSNPQKAKICLWAGLFTLLFALANNIFSIVSAINNGYFSIFYEGFSIISGLLIPLFFLFAAFQLYRQNSPMSLANSTPSPVSEPVFIPEPEAISLAVSKAAPIGTDTPTSDAPESNLPPSV